MNKSKVIPFPAVHNPHAFPASQPIFTVMIPNPAVSLSIKKKDCSSDYTRLVEFQAGIMFKVNPDNSIDFSSFQYEKMMEIIALELKKFVKTGFNSNQKATFTIKNQMEE